MTVALTILIALLGIYLDYLALKRIAAGSVNKYIKYSFVSVVALSYLLILLTPAIIYFFIDEQNAALIMKTAMVMLTTYLTLSVPRLVFYVLWLPTRKRYMLWTGVTVSSVVFLIFLYSIFITRTDYKVNEVELHYKNLPVGFDGYRLVFISDIHIGSMVDALPVRGFNSGPLGGDQQIGARIVEGRIDVVIFFSDPLSAQPHDPDVKALLRIAQVYDIPIANNRATADFIITSPFMDKSYSHTLLDFKNEVNERAKTL